MALSDRQVANLLNAARIASNVDVANPPLVANQMDQRHVPLSAIVNVTLTAGATYRYWGYVADRAYKVISAQFMASSTITASVTNYATVNVVQNNNAGGADTTLATLQITTTNVAVSTSQALVVQASNLVASGQRVDLLLGYGGTGAAFNAVLPTTPYVVDLVVQEV